MSEDLQALEEIRSMLVEIARDGLRTRPEGVLLTYIGTEWVRRMNAPFEQYLTVLAIQQKLNVPTSSRKMVPFILGYCSDILDLGRTATGLEILTLKGDHDSNEIRSALVLNHKFKKAVWVAFIRPLPDGFKRFFNLETLGFTDVKRKPKTGAWLEIEREFITETPIDSPIDGPLVQARVADWVDRNKVDIDVLLDQSPAGEFGRASIDDLLRIIEALPAQVTSQWMIPADVLRCLRNPH